MDYYQKYLKYKQKYLELKEKIYGGINCPRCAENQYCVRGENHSREKSDYTCEYKKKNNSICEKDGQCLSGKCYYYIYNEKTQMVEKYFKEKCNNCQENKRCSF